MVFEPRFLPRFSFVADYYNIKIADVITAPTTQQNLNACVSGNVLNPTACGVLIRNPGTAPGGNQANQPFGLVDFDEVPLNYAALEAQGIDFQARYSLDLVDVIGRDWGRLDYALRGNYLIRQEDFTNIVDPGDAIENDSMVGSPRIRTLSTLTYSPRPWLGLTWDWDFQSSQELRDSDLFLQDADSRPASFIESGAFHQHDFSVRWDVREDVTLRAGVVNAFDAEPAEIIQTGIGDSRGLNTLGLGDIFDFFGRRYYVGFKYTR